ncbi:MAG: PAS domain-containing protein [Salinarimonas sp.]
MHARRHTIEGHGRRLDRVVAPTGVERDFPPGEIIVTKTDLTGRITYANATFLRVAALSEAQAIGAPHAIIRHPDMPRCVFAHLWREIEAGREVFAYVNNLAADGAHYWVFAHVTPSCDAAGRVVGYHSSRRRAPAAARAVIEPLYAELLAIERAHASRKDGLAASQAALVARLEAAGRTYDELILSLGRG